MTQRSRAVEKGVTELDAAGVAPRRLPASVLSLATGYPRGVIASGAMHRTKLTALIVACAGLLSLHCGSSQTAPQSTSQTASDPAAAETAAPRVVEVGLGDVGLDPAAMDPSADPCQDFYRYTCGGWLDSTEIPADRSRYGRFTEILVHTEEVLREILEDAREQAQSGQSADPATTKLGTFYGACMDEAAAEKDGLQGIGDLLAAARAVNRPAAIDAAITALHRHGIWAVFGADAESDFQDSTTNILWVDSEGLGLPDRDYYLGDEESFAEARAFYRGHVQRMFALAGMKPAQAKRAAGDVMQVETELARVTKTQVERRDVAGLYNKVDRAGLAKLAPGFDWDRYFRDLGYPDLQAISATTPGYFERFDALRTELAPRAWSHYLQWQVLHAMAPTLATAFVTEDFALRQHISGQPDQRPRWKRCVTATGEAMGELLGQRYVAKAFGGSSKQAAETMVHEVGQAFIAELDALPWMSPATKAKARAKLDRMSHLIGYPDTWKTYDFDVDPSSYARSMLRAHAFELQRELGKVGKPADRSEWHMTPQTVNAYYNPLANQMAFPAGILQSPFFGADRSVAANLGAIGMVVGHELTHGFDDQGARFDGHGNMKNWWSEEDASAFASKGQCLAAQYDTFEVLPGLTVNGKLTLGENIADLGGVKLALHAYRNMRAGAEEVYVADGLTEDQQFFVSVGQAWCNKAREAETRRRIVVDSHAPPAFRVQGALRNLPAFAEAFQCAEGTPMHPTNTCEIW